MNQFMSEYSYVADPYELKFTDWFAFARQKAAEEKGRPSGHGYDEHDSLRIHKQGTLSEYAASVVLRQYWNAFVEKLERYLPDIGDKIQIRSTHHWRKRGHLLVYPDDPKDKKKRGDCPLHDFVLAYVMRPMVVLVGWLPGVDCMQERFLEDRGRGPTYWVPPEVLRPIGELLPTTNNSR